MRQLLSIKLTDGITMFMDYEEYLEAKEAFKCLELDYQVEVIMDKIYRIDWYDYLDEEWDTIWCTKDDYKSKIKEVKKAKVKFNVIEYN